ncbi:VWA domain-containing protein [Sphingomonas sp.]|uniref:vWA domain-containing protein n=2 Tax=Sphingomonas sp. TaxID=28214 RepID=UPI0035A87A53|nr:hypothetical protein [Parvibaculum sp.]
MSAVVIPAKFDAPLMPARRIVQFGRLLRDNGFMLDLRSVGDAVRLLDTPDLLSPGRVRGSLRAQFCRSRAEIGRFDELFDAYWLGMVGARRRISRQMKADADAVVDRNRASQGAPGGGLASYFDWAVGEANLANQEFAPGGLNMGGLSATSNGSRAKSDFGHIRDREEAQLMLELAERLGRRLRYRLSRRRRGALFGREIDARRSIRRSLATGGIPISLSKRDRPQPPVSLLIFVDVSGSMDAYSLFFTRFLRAMTYGFARVQAFLFHTRLVPVSDALGERDPVQMMDRLALLSNGWSGGTRLGEALNAFHRGHVRGCGGSRTITLMMTDGFDAGDITLLDAQLARLKGVSRKLIWLNPLLGREGYTADSRGARVLAKYANLVLPAHNLNSLLAIEEALARV